MTDDALSPADAFGLLADETRLAIVETLVDRALGSMGDPTSFSDLRRAVGVEDAGKFNYHLGKLQPQFIQKDDDGYLPRFAALEAIRAARSGTLTERPEKRSAELDIDCPRCGKSVVAEHEGSRIEVQCGDDHIMFQSIVPPRTAADHSVSEAVRFATNEIQRDIEKLVDGVCMICGGSLETTVPAEPDGLSSDIDHVYAGFDCTHCVFRTHLPIPIALFRHPAVIAHHWDNGVNMMDSSFFTPEFTFPGNTTIVSEDPFEAHVEVPVDGESITLSVDDALNAEVV